MGTYQNSPTHQLHKITFAAPTYSTLRRFVYSKALTADFANPRVWRGKAWSVALRNLLLWQDITTSSQRAFSEPFFWRQNESDFFFLKRTTKSFPTTVHYYTLGVDPPTKMKVTIRDPPSKKMNASWPLLTGRLRHAIHHRPSSIIKSSHHFIIEIYGALGHPLMPLPPRTKALTRDY